MIRLDAALDDPKALVAARSMDSKRSPSIELEQAMRCQNLWRAVLLQQIADALYVDPDGEQTQPERWTSQGCKRSDALIDRDRAITWLRGGPGFNDVCERAGYHPPDARRLIREHLVARGVQA